MTNPPIGPGAAAMSGEKSRGFLLAGVFAGIVTATVAPLGLLDWLPVIGALINRGGVVSGIAMLVIVFSLWILIYVALRLTIIGQELRAGQWLRQALAQPNGRTAVRTGAWQPAANTITAKRVAAFRSSPDQATAELAARSELDHALGEVAYLPARAVVWALPALGFLGTAAEMSRAVGGLGDTVSATTNFSDLRNSLVSDVVPPLADAFGVTLFALGAGVLCHLFLTWTVAREQRTLLGIEEVTLKLVGPPPANPNSSPVSLNGELTSLTKELGRTREQMASSARQVGRLNFGQLTQLDQLAPLLQSVEQRLGQIHAELSRDLVVTRLGRTVDAGVAR